MVDNSELLRRHLGRTAAPDELRRRVLQNSREERPRRHLAWTTATAVLILVAMWGLRASTAVPAVTRSSQVACVACHT
jgi:hypothetical protein